MLVCRGRSPERPPLAALSPSQGRLTRLTPTLKNVPAEKHGPLGGLEIPPPPLLLLLLLQIFLPPTFVFSEM